MKKPNIKKLNADNFGFKNLGIKSRVILLGTIPALLFAVILAGYAISNIFEVLNQSLHDRGRIIASQLAPAAEYGVISGNTQILQKIVQQILSAEHEVKTVLVLDKKGQILALSGPEIPQDLIANIKQANTHELQRSNGIIFTAPIYRSLVEIEDFSSLSGSDEEQKKPAQIWRLGKFI